MKTRPLFAALVAVAVMLMAGTAFAAPALARAQHIALTGEEIRYFGPAEGVRFADGWTQIRGQQLTGTFSFSGEGFTLEGTHAVLCNARLDGTNGFAWCEVTYTDTATGMTCTGHVNGEITDALGHHALVAPCSDGSLLKGTLQDVEIYPPNVAPPEWVRSEFQGVLLSPGQN
jgi:hypothetical protein